jgi:hypothetical protein
MIRVTQPQAAHFILGKNFLGSDRANNLAGLVKALVGLPGQPDLTPFLAAQARLSHFTPAHLLINLSQNRTLINGPLMRSQGYIIPADDFITWHAATTRQRSQAFNSQFRLWGLDTGQVETLEQAILTTPGEWPASAEAIAYRLLPHLVQTVTQTSRGGRVSTTNNVVLVLEWLAAKGILYVEKDLPGLRDLAGLALNPPDLGSQRYAPLNYFYPGLNLAESPPEAEVQTALARAYLLAFGPATEADLSFWTGFGKSETARAVGHLATETTLVLVEGLPGMLLLLKTQADALAATPPPTVPFINILPADDPFTTAHRASRSRYFSDQRLQRLVLANDGSAQPTILVNGQIVGLWNTQLEQNRLTWQLLSPVDPILLPLIQAEIERVAAFIRPGLDIRVVAE